MNNGEIIEVLNKLIETCYDGKEGFQAAAEGIERTEWKTFFHENALQRAKFAGELQILVRGLGQEPEDSGTVSASLHRGWIALKEALTDKNEQAALEECERGEDRAVANYKKALDKPIPTNIKNIIISQYQDIQKSHDKVRDLRDLIKDPAQVIAPTLNK